MSRTLFVYIFRDLFKIFLMASGALAGIMSFGGLLRPLTREGLDAGQVARMLAYFGPAMTTYSFPVAALFATAVVYGRLSADNELTACKAGGISLLSLTVSGPALVLGLIVAITSLLFLCFIVPASTLRVEKVIYSNLAKLVQSRIERTHEIDFDQTTIFAQEAHVIQPGPDTPRGQQRVELIGPEILSLERDPSAAAADPQSSLKTLAIPKEFYTASRAYLYIDPLSEGEEVNVTVSLHGGFKFPRRYQGATEAGVTTTQYGPFLIPSPIKEDVKFMNVWRLKELYADVSKSRRIQAIISDFVTAGQRKSFLHGVVDSVNSRRRVEFALDNETYVLSIEGSSPAAWSPTEVTVPMHQPVDKNATQPAAPGETADASSVVRAVVFRDQRKGRESLIVRAAQATVRAQPLTDEGKMHVNIVLKDCLQMTESTAVEDSVPRAKYEQSFDYPMSEEAKSMAGQNVNYYETNNFSPGDQYRLRHEKASLINSIIAESNGRASFAISCLILVMVGSALGMMFRSGNFLTAFAVSFIPALLSITLIIAGQRTASNVPWKPDISNNALKLGLALIWSGNGINLLLAVGLLWKLGRR